MDFTNINPHLEPAAIEERAERERNEDRAHDRHVQHSIRLALAELGPKIHEMKKVRDQPGQPGWAGSKLGLELEQARGLATLLCLARSRWRSELNGGKTRAHSVILPHAILLPPVPGKEYGTVHHPKDLVELKRLCDAQVALRFPAEEKAAVPAAAAPEAEPPKAA